MPKTVVGLFENAQLVDAAVLEIEALGFPRQEVRTMREPASFDATGVMSFPRIDFEVDLNREPTRIGATIPEAQAYVQGLRRGGALAFATGPDEKVDAARNVMNRHGAVEVEEIAGPEPVLAGVGHHSSTSPRSEGSVMAGRIRQPGGGACFFVW
jgi:hypothetical protein